MYVLELVLVCVRMTVSSDGVRPSDEDDDPERSGDDGFRAVAAERIEGVRPELNVTLVESDILEENARVSTMSNQFPRWRDDSRTGLQPYMCKYNAAIRRLIQRC